MFGLVAKPVTFEILLVITEVNIYISLLRPRGQQNPNFFYLGTVSSRASHLR